MKIKLLLVSLIFIINSNAFAQKRIATKSIAADAYINSNYADIYEGPNSAKTIAIISKYTPVLILSETGPYTKIRDVWGYDGWVKTSMIGTDAKYVITKSAITPVLKSASTSAAVAFEVTSSVALKVISANDDWLQVEHLDKQRGFTPTLGVLGYK